VCEVKLDNGIRGGARPQRLCAQWSLPATAHARETEPGPDSAHSEAEPAEVGLANRSPPTAKHAR
jgi:hypothetical protein